MPQHFALTRFCIYMYIITANFVAYYILFCLLFCTIRFFPLSFSLSFVLVILLVCRLLLSLNKIYMSHRCFRRSEIIPQRIFHSMSGRRHKTNMTNLWAQFISPKMKCFLCIRHLTKRLKYICNIEMFGQSIARWQKIRFRRRFVFARLETTTEFQFH